MLSIIVCSRYNKLQKDFTDNIKNTVGVDYEIIAINNSENSYSIFSAYNFGINKSKYPYLCLVHEDVIFHSSNWGENVIAHLQDPKTGIIGVDGCDLVTHVPAAWPSIISATNNVIISDPLGKKATLYPINQCNQQKRSSIILDGLFLCARKELMQKNHFDENLKGFHGYDYDITIQSTVAGYTNFVVYDIVLEHNSRGKTHAQFYRNLILIFRKWGCVLPLKGQSFTENQIIKIRQIEEESLKKLLKKMVRKGFGKKEIISEITFFANVIHSNKLIKHLEFNVFFSRLFNKPKSLLK